MTLDTVLVFYYYLTNYRTSHLKAPAIYQVTLSVGQKSKKCRLDPSLESTRLQLSSDLFYRVLEKIHFPPNSDCQPGQFLEEIAPQFTFPVSSQPRTLFSYMTSVSAM